MAEVDASLFHYRAVFICRLCFTTQEKLQNIKGNKCGDGIPLEKKIRAVRNGMTVGDDHHLCEECRKRIEFSYENEQTWKLSDTKYEEYSRTGALPDKLAHAEIPDEWIKKFPCHECNMRFKTKGALIKHLRSRKHSIFVCNDCTILETFSTLNDFDDHYKKVHPEIERHSCYECNQPFASRSNLLAHNERTHRANNPAVAEPQPQENRVDSNQSPQLPYNTGSSMEISSANNDRLDGSTVVAQSHTHAQSDGVHNELNHRANSPDQSPSTIDTDSQPSIGESPPGAEPQSQGNRVDSNQSPQLPHITSSATEISSANNDPIGRSTVRSTRSASHAQSDVVSTAPKKRKRNASSSRTSGSRTVDPSVTVVSNKSRRVNNGNASSQLQHISNSAIVETIDQTVTSTSIANSTSNSTTMQRTRFILPNDGNQPSEEEITNLKEQQGYKKITTLKRDIENSRFLLLERA